MLYSTVVIFRTCHLNRNSRYNLAGRLKTNNVLGNEIYSTDSGI